MFRVASRLSMLTLAPSLADGPPIDSFEPSLPPAFLVRPTGPQTW